MSCAHINKYITYVKGQDGLLIVHITVANSIASYENLFKIPTFYVVHHSPLVHKFLSLHISDSALPQIYLVI